MTDIFLGLHGPTREQFPASLGAKLSAQSLSIVFASDASLPIVISNDTNYGVVGANTLRTAAQIGNAAGAADFAAGNSSAQTLRVVVATNQAAIPISATSLPLPTGASTSALQTALNAQIPTTLGQKTMAASLAVALASDQSSLPVTGTFFPATQAVSQSSTPWLFAQSKTKANAPNTVDYTSGGGVTTSAYTQLVASTTSALTRLYIQDTSGSSMIIATGAAASEVDQFYYGPGFASFVDFAIPAGTRIAIKALDVSATTGRLITSFFT